VNHTERSQILEQVENGQVSVEEALGLMSSQGEEASLSEPTGAPRWLRIRVSNLETGASKVNVSIPFSWVKFGWALGSCFAPEIKNFDLDDMTAILDQVDEGYIVHVEDAEDNKRVEIYVD
jgi:hypothetical protein